MELGNPKTKISIINSIETATGLGKHKIKVFEMKKEGFYDEN